MRHATLIPVIALVAALAGCTEFPRVDDSLGKSAAQTIVAQTYDPAAAAHPPALAPGVGDGQRIENVLTAQRKDVPVQASQQVAQTPQFQAGQQ